MNIHYLQHVHFEDPANILKWAGKRGHKLTRTKLYRNEGLPELKNFDWLIIMGGPMSVHEVDKYPWLITEKLFIKTAIETGKIVTGICLGAQLLADVLGGKVYKNKNKEIGWFPVTITRKSQMAEVFKGIPDEFTPFHWHGETFDIPEGAVKVAGNSGCSNQAFIWNNKIMALQFHLESSKQSIKKLIKNCGNDITDGPYIQAGNKMLPEKSRLADIKKHLYTLLDNIEKYSI
jgi:GMP synthase-like glutamine amidotransferase